MKINAVLRIAALVSCLHVAGLLPSTSMADPATPSSERVAKYGNWLVVKKPSSYIIFNDAGEPVKKGRHFLCSAALFASNASLELQATNDEAWSVYVAAEGWNYRYGLKALKIKSATQEVHVGQAVYHGSMISAASHYLGAAKPISIVTIKSLIAQNRPISIHDNTGRKLVTFPNSGNDLSKAFNQAIKCTLANLS